MHLRILLYIVCGSDQVRSSRQKQISWILSLFSGVIYTQPIGLELIRVYRYFLNGSLYFLSNCSYIQDELLSSTHPAVQLCIVQG